MTEAAHTQLHAAILRHVMAINALTTINVGKATHDRNQQIVRHHQAITCIKAELTREKGTP